VTGAENFSQSPDIKAALGALAPIFSKNDCGEWTSTASAWKLAIRKRLGATAPSV
jgi:hypothetical protein